MDKPKKLDELERIVVPAPLRAKAGFAKTHNRRSPLSIAELTRRAAGEPTPIEAAPESETSSEANSAE